MARVGYVGFPGQHTRTAPGVLVVLCCVGPLFAWRCQKLIAWLVLLVLHWRKPQICLQQAVNVRHQHTVDVTVRSSYSKTQNGCWTECIYRTQSALHFFAQANQNFYTNCQISGLCYNFRRSVSSCHDFLPHFVHRSWFTIFYLTADQPITYRNGRK